MQNKKFEVSKRVHVTHNTTRTVDGKTQPDILPWDYFQKYSAPIKKGMKRSNAVLQ